MTELHSRSDTTAALLGLLEATDLVVGDGKRPEDAGWQGTPGGSTFVGYVVLRSIPGGFTRAEGRGTITSPDSDAVTFYELLSVGATRAQSEHISDIATRTLVGQRPTVPGRAIQSIAVEEYGDTDRDDTLQPGEPSEFLTSDVLRVSSTPRAD